MSKIAELLDKLEKIENDRLEKIKAMRENKGAIEYWEDHGDGGFWKPLTEEIAGKDWEWELNDLRTNLHYLVKTEHKGSSCIQILSQEDYKRFVGNKTILYQGSYAACKDFIKV